MGVFQSLLGFPFTPCSFMEIGSRGWMWAKFGCRRWREGNQGYVWKRAEMIHKTVAFS